MSDIVVLVVHDTGRADQDITCNKHAWMHLYYAIVPNVPKINHQQNTAFQYK